MTSPREKGKNAGRASAAGEVQNFDELMAQMEVMQKTKQREEQAKIQAAAERRQGMMNLAEAEACLLKLSQETDGFKENTLLVGQFSVAYNAYDRWYKSEEVGLPVGVASSQDFLTQEVAKEEANLAQHEAERQERFEKLKGFKDQFNCKGTAESLFGRARDQSFLKSLGSKKQSSELKLLERIEIATDVQDIVSALESYRKHLDKKTRVRTPGAIKREGNMKQLLSTASVDIDKPVTHESIQGLIDSLQLSTADAQTGSRPSGAGAGGS
jgi:hypothetical protein